MDDLSNALRQVASCNLDIRSSKIRHLAVQEAHSLLFENEYSNDDVAKVVNALVEVVDQCRTKYSQTRISKIFIRAIVHYTSTLQLHKNQLKQLWIALSNIITSIGGTNQKQRRNIFSTLFVTLDTCLEEYVKGNDKRSDQQGESQGEEEKINENETKEGKQSLVIQSLYDVIWDQLKSNGNDWSICLSFMTHLHQKRKYTKINGQATSAELMEYFVKNTFKQKQIASLESIELCHTFLQYVSCYSEQGGGDTDDEKAMTTSIGTLFSSMGLKLRSSAESALPPIYSIFLQLRPPSSTTTVSLLEKILCTNLHQEGKLIPSILKQMTSSKEHLRLLASDVLVQLSKFTSCFIPTIESILIVMNSATTTSSKVKIGATTGITTIPGVKFSSSDHRFCAYTTLQRIAISFIKTSMNGNKGLYMTFEELETILNALFEVYTSVLAKESSASKEVGIKSLITWVVLSKDLLESDDVGKSLASYSKVIDYFKKPIVDAGKKSSSSSSSSGGNEFRSRVGSLFIDHIHEKESMIGSIVKDLIHCGKDAKAVVTGLQSIVDASLKKHGNSSMVAQIDGLIATYMILLHGGEDGLSSTIRSKVLLPGASAAGGSSKSFLFSKAMTDASRSDPIVNSLLHKTVSMAHCLGKEMKHLVCLKDDDTPSAAAYAIACCIAAPNLISCVDSNVSSSQYVLTSLEKAIASSTSRESRESDSIATALLYHMNFLEQQKENAAKEFKVAKEVKDGTNDYSDEKEQNRLKFDVNTKSVHEASYNLMGRVTTSKHFTHVMLLAHYETTLKTVGKSQRVGLEKFVTDAMSKVGGDGVEIVGIAEVILECLVDGGKKDDNKFSFIACDSMYKAGLSFIETLGGVGGNYDTEFSDPDDPDSKDCELAWTICVKELAPKLSNNLSSALKDIYALSADDVGIYRTQAGILYRSQSESSDNNAAATKTKRGTEEEEWERQVKEEIARKKAMEAGADTTTKTLTADEKVLLEEQTARKKTLHHLVDVHFCRCLKTIQALCMSDIEIGNSILSIVAKSVIEATTAKCEIFKSIQSLKDLGFETMCALSSCVYEIDDIHSKSLAKSLLISQFNDGNETRYVPLPSTFKEAAISLQEMDEYDDCLSLNSFVFLFPIIRSALTGPRSCHGCDTALQVLNRHVELLDSDGLVTLRKEMSATVLELLSHDRSKTFVDPTPVSTLINIYSVEKKYSASEIAPLLGTSGSLGVKNCRLAAMKVLGSILIKQPKVIKTNPLVENRIWVNCFSADEDIKKEARVAWKVGHNVSDEDDDLPPPSKMFAIALTPLISHEDKDIAQAAASAYAHGLSCHSEVIEKNFISLFKSYIEAYPTITKAVEVEEKIPNQAETTAKPKKVVNTSKLSVTTKKTTKTKKKATGTSAIAALTKTKKKSTSKRKPSGPITLTSNKQKERTFDQNVLAAQFEPKIKEEKKDEVDNEEKICTRQGVLRVIASATGCELKLETNSMKLLVIFLLAYGLADVNDNVRAAATNALRDVSSSGLVKDAIDFLLPLLENSLKNGNVDKSLLVGLSTDKVFETTDASDKRKEGVVIALGATAVHLNDQNDVDKISDTSNMLISALSTPSENVQSSVALCLSKLMKKGQMQSRAKELLSQLIQECLKGKTLASRRGAAYGISAVVKGSGIASLKKFEVVNQLEEACSMGSSTEKEGALFAIELLSSRLGLLFEPYVIVLLPSLLQSFSDGSVHVRKAANSSIGLVMSKLSGHGVKLLMPAVLTALESEDWRTKQASIHMLGTMSHCAPKQLASCLPRVVPKLTESFSDTHPKVKESAKNALEEISKVIRNPEISEISSTLLQALTDPSHSTLLALESLIETEFLHAIDAASLSLIVPVLHRGLRDRAATTKRYAALIAGNICTMINEPKDFVPYLPMLLPDLKGVLVDPIPDCRSISAKALGSLTRTLGEATFPDLRPWLINTLKSDQGSSVERSGAAQGLTEVICAGGARLVENVMNEDILPLISHPNAAYREGVLWVLTFLPSTLGQAFAPLIESSFPALISGLSDENEPVRDVAMRAGRVTIRSHGKAHVDKILPSLEHGLSDEDYRIRAASLNLMGDLLGCIGGSKIMKGNVESQDDIRQAERTQAQIALVLGPEIRKRVLSSLYLRRSDTTAVVRQSAVQVWKSVVSVTPRTLKDILDTLVGQVVTALASGHPDHTQVAGRCLGDIVSKLGDTVLPEIIPVLRDALYRGDIHTRIGACVGLNEVIACSSKEQIAKYLQILVKAVQDALCDDLEKVRGMAASCFQSLYSIVGNKAFDEVIPALIVGMESSDNDNSSRVRSINGLTSILKIRSKELLPYLIPRLIRKPVTTNQANALGSIYTVTGDSIYAFLPSIIPTFLSELVALDDNDSDTDEKDREDALRRSLISLINSVTINGVDRLVSEIASKCSSDKVAMRKECCWMFKVLVEEREDKSDFFEQISTILRELLYRLNDDSDVVIVSTNSALSSLTKHVPAEELVNHIEFIRNLLASMVSDARRRKGGVGDGEFLLPGFNRPKGLEPLLPIYQRGILYGNSSTREIAAAGLGELVKITSNKYLAGPFVIKLTGPLLRIVGDRNPPSVKIAIIQTLGLILTKGGPSLRAFVPQFQTTFSKALSDPSRQVRVEAIKALGLLMPLSTRVDPLLKELVSTALGNGTISTLESAGVVAVQTATFEALATVLKNGGRKAKLPDSIPSAMHAGKMGLFNDDEGIRVGAAKVVSAAAELLNPDEALDVVTELLESKQDSTEVKHGLACLCRYILPTCVGSQIPQQIMQDMKEFIIDLMNDESIVVKEIACTAAAIVLGVGPDTDDCMKSMEKPLLECMKPKETMEVLKGVARGLSIAVQLSPDLFLNKAGQPYLEAALENAMSGNQRVQLAYNDFLWFALNVNEGDQGLEKFSDTAMFEKAKKMKSLYSKVLVRMKNVVIED